MAISDCKFSDFERTIRALPLGKRLERSDLLIPSLRLHRGGGLEMYYAPNDGVNSKAALILLGITPGWTQMEIAYRVAREEVERGSPASEICRIAKQQGSFAGSMRTNLVKMLDELGVATKLDLKTTLDLFHDAANLVHTGSAVRYPVFVQGRNYTGHSPNLLQTPVLRECVESILAPELASVPDALIVPLGKAVSEVLEHLVTLGRVDGDRCLFGFPHPSGANGNRTRDFSARRDDLVERVDRYFEERRSTDLTPRRA